MTVGAAVVFSAAASSGVSHDYATHAEWTAHEVRFAHGPRTNSWDCGAKLHDPDGFLIRLWDERSMKEK